MMRPGRQFLTNVTSFVKANSIQIVAIRFKWEGFVGQKIQEAFWNAEVVAKRMIGVDWTRAESENT